MVYYWPAVTLTADDQTSRARAPLVLSFSLLIPSATNKISQTTRLQSDDDTLISKPQSAHCIFVHLYYVLLSDFEDSEY